MESQVLESSSYNFFVHRDDGVVVYNGRTGTFALLNVEAAQKVRDGTMLRSDPDASVLLEFGILLDNSNEYESIVKKYVAARTTKTLSITLVPTLDCNRSCKYCYQANYRHSRVMTEDIQDATVRFVDRKLQSGFSNLSCTWYGGEPLQERAMILSLSRRLLDVADARGVPLLPMRLVTNGVLLDQRTASDLATAGFRSAQISFDSLYDNGTTKRGLLTSAGLPSLILTNAVAATRHLKISIRVNVTSSNRSSTDRMIALLREYGLGENYYLARVSDFEGEAGARVDVDGTRRRADGRDQPFAIEDEDAIKRKNYAHFELDKVVSDPSALRTAAAKLTPKTHFCGATGGGMFVIDPEGHVSKCWLSAGSKSEALGNVLDYKKDADSANSQVWLEHSPFKYRACSSCKVLPLCMGGCSHPRIFMGASKPPCESIKFQIGSLVDLVGARLQFE